MKDPKRVKAGKKSREKGGKGMRQIKALLESLGHEVKIVHGTGMEDVQGGDLWIDRSWFAQVKFTAQVPKGAYKAVEDCPVAFVRLVSETERGLPWLMIQVVDPKKQLLTPRKRGG